MVRPVPGSLRRPVPCSRSEPRPCATAVVGRAAFSRCGRYRWLLERRWLPPNRITPGGQGLKTLIYCGLNPSRADAGSDDPTLRRLCGFARGWGYQRLVVLNLFALVTPSPAALRRHPFPIGAGNDAVLESWLQRWSLSASVDLWLGWGAHGSFQGRDHWLLERLVSFAALRRRRGAAAAFCLGTTQGGHPRHPLYRPASAMPQAWIGEQPCLMVQPGSKGPASTVRL